MKKLMDDLPSIKSSFNDFNKSLLDYVNVSLKAIGLVFIFTGLGLGRWRLPEFIKLGIVIKG